MNTRDQYEFQTEFEALLAKHNRYMTSASWNRDEWQVSFKPIPVDYNDTNPYLLPRIIIGGADVTRYCEIDTSNGNVWIPYDRIKIAKKQSESV